jgi:hypothetical protein
VIKLRQLSASDADPMEFEVTVSESGSQSQHRVTLSAADFRRLTRSACTPDQCVEAAFRFLLEREPKEAILRRFDITVIARYFPEFEAQLPRYFAPPG